MIFLWGIMPLLSYGQKDASRPNYPQNYFRNPLNIPILLAGNFGECRPGHFHSGIDIKTNGRENLPVYAAADGYISRIKTEPGGFGHALYITHPNGYTTLYAHLNKYTGPVQEYLRQQQYEQEQWNLDLQLPPTKFPVKKGQQIAWSGNTGASTAPHLHFEIRNSQTEHPLNPELFGLPVTDHISPVPTSVAIYDLLHSIYNGPPEEYKLHKKGASYVPAKDTLQTDALIAGIGLQVNDYMNGSHNTLAFYTAKLYKDDKEECTVRLDDIGYDETRYVNAYADYSTKVLKGYWIQCLFELQGNKLDHIYQQNWLRGGLDLKDSAVHKIRIEVTDDKGNESGVSFYLQYSGKAVKDTLCNVFHPGDANLFEHPNVKFTLGDSMLYDNICFKLKSSPGGAGSYSDKYLVGTPNIPAHKYYDLYIKPNKPIPFALRDKVAMIYWDGKNEEGHAAKDAGAGWYMAAVRDFGTFYLAADTVAPVIVPQQKEGSNLAKASRMSFTIKDAVTYIKTYRAELDGKWVCLERHRDNYFYEFDEHCSKGKHELIIKASDGNDNEQTLQFTFTK